MITIEILRQFRLFGYAIFDIAVSLLGMFLLSPLFSKLFFKLGIKIPKINWLFLTLPIGIVTHILVGNFTPMTKNFLDLQSNYVLKIVIIALLILGLRNIQKSEK